MFILLRENWMAQWLILHVFLLLEFRSVVLTQRLINFMHGCYQSQKISGHKVGGRQIDRSNGWWCSVWYNGFLYDVDSLHIERNRINDINEYYLYSIYIERTFVRRAIIENMPWPFVPATSANTSEQVLRLAKSRLNSTWKGEKVWERKMRAFGQTPARAGDSYCMQQLFLPSLARIGGGCYKVHGNY